MSYLFSNKYCYTKRVVKFTEHSSQPIKYRTDKKWLLEKCFKQYRTTFSKYFTLIELLIFSVILQSIICCWCLTWLETIKREFSFQLIFFFFFSLDPLNWSTVASLWVTRTPVHFFAFTLKRKKSSFNKQTKKLSFNQKIFKF